MKWWGKLIAWIGFVFLLLGGIAMWYKVQFSMEMVKGYEINDSTLEHRLLIATQGSDYKNSLVDEIISEIKEDSVYIRIVDVNELPIIKETDWNAILILHTWEYWKPESNSKNFVKASSRPENIFTVATSGSGKEAIEGVDAISSASVKADIEVQKTEILYWLNQQLN